MVVIILTTTVFVQNKCYLFQTDPLERLNTYKKSINLWLSLTNFKIILVENSGYSFNEFESNDRFEVISFNEETLPEASYLKGNNSKGASELFAINYALEKTKFKYSFIIKITGRYFIPDFENYILSFDLNNYHALIQNSGMNCEIVGSHFNFKNMVFNKNTNINHIEFLYKERIDKLNKIVVIKQLKINPTQIGGLNEIRYFL